VDSTSGTGRLLRSHENAHDHWVRSLRLTPNGRVLISGSADMSIGLWEVNLEGTDIRLLKLLKGHTDRVRCVRVGPDGDQFFSGSSDMTIRCWKFK
jgi:WD40 repeat protein